MTKWTIPDRIEELRTARAEAYAQALEDAAEARGMWFGFNTNGEPDGSYCTVQAHDPGGMKYYVSSEAIRSLPNPHAPEGGER
jgi:hypothetical protein